MINKQKSKKMSIFIAISVTLSIATVFVVSKGVIEYRSINNVISKNISIIDNKTDISKELSIKNFDKKDKNLSVFQNYAISILSLKKRRSIYKIEENENKKYLRVIVLTKDNKYIELYNPLYKSIKKDTELSLIIGSISFIPFLLMSIILFIQKSNSRKNEILLEKNIKRIKEQLNIRLNSLNDKVLISTVDIEGKTTTVSDKFLNLIQYSKEDIINKTHPALKDIQLDKNNNKDIYDIKIKKIDNSYCFIDLNISPIYKEDTLLGFNLLMEDKTIQKELESLKINQENIIKSELDILREKEALLINKSKLDQISEVISMIAQQWRQPLSAIVSTSSFLKIKIEKNQYKKVLFQEKLNNINKYSMELSEVINDFRNFYKNDKEAIKFNLNNIINKSIFLIKPSLEDNIINIKRKFNANSDIVNFPIEIQQVILNILKNSEEAIARNKIEEPFITIETEDIIDNNCSISIIDNAHGISNDIIDKVFNPYFSTKIKEGSGLGLYMSKMIIENNCLGNINISNFKNGTKTTITIPKDLKNVISS